MKDELIGLITDAKREVSFPSLLMAATAWLGRIFHILPCGYFFLGGGYFSCDIGVTSIEIGGKGTLCFFCSCVFV